MCRKRQGAGRTFQRIRPHYDDTQIAGLPLMTGHYMMTARFLQTLETDPDESATPRDAVCANRIFFPSSMKKTFPLIRKDHFPPKTGARYLCGTNAGKTVYSQQEIYVFFPGKMLSDMAFLMFVP